MKNLNKGAQKISAQATSDKAINDYLKRAKFISAAKVAFSVVFLAAFIGFGVTGVCNRAAAATKTEYSEVQNG